MEFKKKTKKILFLLVLMIFIFASFLTVYFLKVQSFDKIIILTIVLMVITVSCAYYYRYLIEDNNKLKIQKAIKKYLPYNVVENIDNVSLGGKRKDITVLFADIRNFTTITEEMDASSTMSILNEYFGALVPIIEENKGILNKFVGDAVLAIFGDPNETENHALDAVRCADKMLKKVKLLQEKWLDEGKPKIETGIGIATGETFIGNIGSQNRLEYTVIGDTVNTANRIESYNKVYKTQFLISSYTYQYVRGIADVIKISEVKIRGKAKKLNIYEVLRLTQ